MLGLSPPWVQRDMGWDPSAPQPKVIHLGECTACLISFCFVSGIQDSALPQVCSSIHASMHPSIHPAFHLFNDSFIHSATIY